MTFDKVKEIIIENLGVNGEDVKPEAKLIEDLEADSLDAVEVSMALEDEFDIEIDDDAFAGLSTVQDIVNYIENNK